MKDSGNILILGVQVPFTRGGAEVLVDCLARELRNRDYTVDVVQLPFTALPKSALIEQIALWRALNLDAFAGREVDLVIPTKFPSYLVAHRNKVPWLVHQHRQAYELYGSRFGDFDSSAQDESLRQMIYEADMLGLKECSSIFTISENVSARLDRYLQIPSTPLLPPPPLLGRYRTGSRGDYILSIGRICSIKRIDLMVRSLAQVDRRLSLKIVGGADEPNILEYLKSEIRKHHLQERVEFLGRVDDESLISLLADSFAVYYAPHDEDYGFVSIEARAAGKPVVTATDSGTVLSFIHNEKNGLVTAPSEQEISAAFNRLLEDQELYSKLAFIENPDSLCVSWDRIVSELTSGIHAMRPAGLQQANL